MDQVPRGNESLSDNSLFGDGQNFTYDNLFPSGNDHSFNDAGWGLNAGNYPSLSRASPQAAPSWPQSATHLSATNTPTAFHTPSDIYGRSPAHSPAPYNQGSTFGGYNGQNFQYQQPYGQSLPQRNNQAFQGFNNHAPGGGTIAPQALAPRDQQQLPPRQTGQPAINSIPSPSIQQATANQDALIRAIPTGDQNGRFLTVDFAQLVKVTNSERAAMYANIGKQPQEFPVNRPTALPAYVKRRSRSELKQLAKNDPKLLAKLNSKSLKSVSVPRPAGSTASAGQRDSAIKYEGDSSSTEDSSDDSDVSLYSDEEEETVGAPLPFKRPDDDPKAAVEYDAIKALWRNKKKTIDAESIRKGLTDFWTIVKTIRDRWKADTEAVKEADGKKKVGDLDILKGRVRIQREMLEVAVKAAMKHGHKQTVELLSENSSLLFVCYQFLLDRAKAEDYNGSLAQAILELLIMTTSITKEKLDATYLAKPLDRYVKLGNAKTKFYAKKVIDNAANTTAKAKPVKPEPETVAGVKRSSSTAGNVHTAAAPKKPATANGTTPTARLPSAVKKSIPSTDASKKSTTTTAAPVAKAKTVVAKPSGFFSSLQSVGKKPGTSNAEKAAPRPTDKKPAVTMNSKPAFNLAETLANLSKPSKEEPKKPEAKPETPREYVSPEKKAKRAARLARGATNVRFKDGMDLVQIRIFEHDPAEELDHDASQMRDVKDVGGEGRMLKQHKDMMDVDEDDDSGDEVAPKLVEWKAPSPVDFSMIDPEERDRMYAPYGGGKLQPESPESAVRQQYEANNLIVFYSDPSEIPPNPREPADPYNGDQGRPVAPFAMPPERFMTRARERTQQRAAQAFKQMPPGMSNVDLSSFASYANRAPTQQSQPQALHTTPPSNATPDISQLLKTLTANGLIQPQQPSKQPSAPPMQAPQSQGYPSQQPFNFNIVAQQTPKLPNGEPDLSAILAALGASAGPTAAPAPSMGNFSTYPNTSGFQRPTPNGGQDVKTKRADNPFYKTKVCKYWQEGKCLKGAECSYLHE